MKTIKFLSTVTAVAIVAIATAVEKPKMDVIPLPANRAMISITNENAAYFELSVERKDGNLVYYRQSSVPQTDYQKIFDFKNLENGIYVLSLKVNDTRLSRKFQVTNNGIFVGSAKLRFDPYFKFENNVLKLSFLNFDNENIRLNISNDEGLVYETRLGKEFTISSGYDLSKLDKGNYKVVLSSSNQEYDFNIVK